MSCDSENVVMQKITMRIKYVIFEEKLDQRINKDLNGLKIKI